MTTSKKRKISRLPCLGWREWVALPELGVEAIKAKVDTGARTSCLHAFGVEEFERDGVPHVRFGIHPVQRRSKPSIQAELPLLEYRKVRSSSGKAERRPVVLTRLVILGKDYPIELTLTSRDAMGFRMLLGREATRRKFLVNPGRSYLGGKPEKPASETRTNLEPEA